MLDETMLDLESDIFFRRIGFGKEIIKDILRSKQKTPYSSLESYVKVAVRILEKLEPLDFAIYSIESNDHFILPDNSCFQVRGQLENYANPLIEEIIQIGIPINHRLFILATPQKLKTRNHGIQYITDDNSDIVFDINKDLYNFARAGVACKDEEFLKKTIAKIKNGSA